MDVTSFDMDLFHFYSDELLVGSGTLGGGTLRPAQIQNTVTPGTCSSDGHGGYQHH